MESMMFIAQRAQTHGSSSREGNCSALHLSGGPEGAQTNVTKACGINWRSIQMQGVLHGPE